MAIIDDFFEDGPFLVHPVLCLDEVHGVPFTRKLSLHPPDDVGENIVADIGADDGNGLRIGPLLGRVDWRDIGPATLDLVELTLVFEEADRLAHGLPAHPKASHKVLFGRELALFAIGALFDLFTQYGRYISILRHNDSPRCTVICERTNYKYFRNLYCFLPVAAALPHVVLGKTYQDRIKSWHLLSNSGRTREGWLSYQEVADQRRLCLRLSDHSSR